MDIENEIINYDLDEPAKFTERIFDEKNGGKKCLLCRHSNKEGDGKSLKDQLDKIDKDLCGKIEDDAIFDLQAEFYEEKIRKPSMRLHPDQKFEVLCADDCRRHYLFHVVNPKRMLKNDIMFVDNAQRFLQENGVLRRNQTSGKYSIEMSYLKQWSILSRNKLDLVRYYRQEYLRGEEETKVTNGPTEFSSF